VYSARRIEELALELGPHAGFRPRPEDSHQHDVPAEAWD
jgi:hypothetical protein